MSIATTGLTVSALAGRVGVRPDTIRYYERIRLLPAAAAPAATIAAGPKPSSTGCASSKAANASA